MLSDYHSGLEDGGIFRVVSVFFNRVEVPFSPVIRLPLNSDSYNYLPLLPSWFQ